MFLRSLQLRGFKSFAEKTTLEFAPGLSVIVGPNGSGKSNLVDAIAWVLGEQGPRALRGGHMADVIFAGSPDRQALGMAQVSLVIDNSEGLIPVDVSEIEVARVVYRSGESQYLLGGEPVRLMDIQELLSDSGIGRGLHTLVGQGQLEDVLIARPEDRRLYIEEAAGIAKHRRRKERAQRKLASLDQDLLRLQDVMTELKRQLRPLKQQAEAAGRYEELSAASDDLAWRLAAARLRDLYAERDGGRPGWEEGHQRREAAERELATLDDELSSLGQRLAEAETALSRSQAAESDAGEERSRAEAALREAVRAEGEARARVAAEAGRGGRLATVEAELRRTEQALAQTVSVLRDREADLEEAEREFERADRARKGAEEARRRAREEAITRRAEAEGRRRTLEVAHQERGRLTDSLTEVRGRETRSQRARDRLEAEIERLDAAEAPLVDRQAALQRDREGLAAAIADAEGQERVLDARGHAVQARRRALAETPGRRFVHRRGDRAAGLLAGLIEVELEWEKAVWAALGELADAVVYEDLERAVADAGDAAGAILAVAPDSAGGFVLPGERSILSVMRVEPRAEAVVAALLRHVYLAADAEDAVARYRRHPGASFVSRDGVLIGPALVRTAPTPSEDEVATRREQAAVERDRGRVRKELAEKRKLLADVEASLARIADELKAADAAITDAAERMGRLDADLAVIRREQQIIEERLAGLDQSISGPGAPFPEEVEVPDDGDDTPAVAEPPLQLRVEVEALRRDRRRLAQTLALHRSEVERLRAGDPQTLLEEAARAGEARELAERALHEVEARAREATSTRAEAARTAAAVRSAEAAANRAWRAAAEGLQRLRDEYEDQEQARRDVQRRIAEAERALSEGHHRSPEEAAAALEADDTVTSLQRKSDLIARRMGLLGRVNLVAAEEYRALQERHDFLYREIEDVKKARRDLQVLVADVDRKIVEIFDGAFRDVAAEFSSMVTTLFPNGEGKLTLTDPGDLLHTGIEIEARPGRKRVKRISLLSGGERALTALAFLFAIFRARPSPFYLLDEVEAALDDINLHRFIELVREFARESQVLLVTHQKRTMEAADLLYGVSMARDGVSSVISQRVAEAVR
jgi:chromosome segregation protein